MVLIIISLVCIICMFLQIFCSFFTLSLKFTIKGAGVTTVKITFYQGSDDIRSLILFSKMPQWISAKHPSLPFKSMLHLIILQECLGTFREK